MLFYGQPMLFELAGAHISGKSSFFHDYNSVFFRECMLYCCHGAQEIQKTREIRKQHAQKREAAIVFPGIAASRPINPRTGLGRRCCGLACGRLCSPMAAFAASALLLIGFNNIVNNPPASPPITIPKFEFKSESTEKAEEKDKPAAIPSQPNTTIYRYGGTNPGNLTPREKDKYTGLSFSTIPLPGAAETTIEALNSTGVVYAIRDGKTHVSVRPVGGSMQDWIDAGVASIWTQAVKSVVVKWDGVN